MWCLATVFFMLQSDYELFPTQEMGDVMEDNNREVTCTGNHRLLNDIHSWIESHSTGVVKVFENLDGYDTTTIYDEGVKVYEHCVEEEREDL